MRPSSVAAESQDAPQASFSSQVSSWSQRILVTMFGALNAVLFALSIGIKTGLLQKDLLLDLHPETLGRTVIFFLFGLAVTLVVGNAVKATFRFAEELRWSKGWIWQTWTAFGIATASFLALAAGASMIQMTGVTAVAQAMTASPASGQDHLLFFVSLTCALPWLAVHALIGARQGRERA